MIENYEFKYRSRGKWIYKPKKGCDRRGQQVIDFIERCVKFPEYFYHFRSGGHVAALHEHLKNKFFFKIDIKNFFYSIARNRVHRALAECGMRGAPTFAVWSTVRSPYPHGPKYVLPIGFRQSPHIASLVLMCSPVVAAIEDQQAKGALISVYLDDIIGSSDDEGALKAAYEAIKVACVAANLMPNPDKLVDPKPKIAAFNCNLTHGAAVVTEERIAKFYTQFPSVTSRISFEAYVARVASENIA
jgi:reverse transcriptase-like protein